MVLDNFTLEVLRSDYSEKDIDNIEVKLFYSLSKTVPLPSSQDNDNNEQTSMSLNYAASMVSQPSSVMAKSNLFTSNLKEHSFSLQDESG